MKMLDNNIVREMTEEEIKMFSCVGENADEEATTEDYEAALAEMGVTV